MDEPTARHELGRSRLARGDVALTVDPSGEPRTRGLWLDQAAGRRRRRLRRRGRTETERRERRTAAPEEERKARANAP
jgi:hypothetical protein